MNVQELIEQLQTLDPERIVILQKDAEGNGYSPLSCFWEGAYEAYSTWSGEAGLDKLTDELIAEGYSEDDLCRGEPAVVLVPVN